MTTAFDPRTRDFLRVVAGGALVLAGAPVAFAQRAPVEGTEFRRIKPAVPTESDKKLEVIEFFWYGCPHCFSLEPAIKDWAKKLPADVAFRKVHVPFREVRHQQLFFTLDSMGKADELADKVFAAIHNERNPLNTPEKMADLLAKSGVDRKQFMDTFESFSVKTRMRKATQLTEAFQVDGVPALGINGKYFTAPSMAGGNAQALAVADFLLDAERKGAK